MLPKTNRAEKKDIDLLFRVGKFLSSPVLALRFILMKKKSAPRISFIVPKSIVKTAVKRNLLRRRGYTALKKHINTLPPGTIGVFTFKKYEVNGPILEDEIKNILTKIN
jgi:ribonuclease P protein component